MASTAQLLALLTELGGVVRAVVVAERGISRWVLDDAVARGQVIRPRRGWIALPTAERTLVAAARFGVVLTCRTQASLLGLWVHHHGGPPHFAVTHNAKRKLAVEAKLHWGRPLVPRDPGALVDPIENVLANIAECEPFEQALATWESALNKSLVALDALRGYSWKPAARRVLEQAMPFADAGLETYLRTRLRWLRVPILTQIWIAGHRVDTLIGDRLIVQIDGAHHVGAQRSEDIRHDAELRLMGYTVIRVSYTQIMFEWPMVQDLIMRAVAQGLHLAV
ncbi:endonuclease domain-containing protein [Microbacterium sp. ZW T6_19]|uniref:endonuclease domain-containing protein n=1 Tax=Microbacterium sp. ZW T6_19 TaxID=3378082 RepID=UPI003854499C